MDFPHLTQFIPVAPYGVVDFGRHIGLGNGYSPVRHQAITWNNADSPIDKWTPGTNKEIWIKIKHLRSAKST